MAECDQRYRPIDIKTHLALMTGAALTAWVLVILVHWLFTQASGHPEELARWDGLWPCSGGAADFLTALQYLITQAPWHSAEWAFRRVALTSGLILVLIASAAIIVRLTRISACIVAAGFLFLLWAVAIANILVVVPNSSGCPGCSELIRIGPGVVAPHSDMEPALKFLVVAWVAMIIGRIAVLVRAGQRTTPNYRMHPSRALHRFGILSLARRGRVMQAFGTH